MQNMQRLLVLRTEKQMMDQCFDTAGNDIWSVLTFAVTLLLLPPSLWLAQRSGTYSLTSLHNSVLKGLESIGLPGTSVSLKVH